MMIFTINREKNTCDLNVVNMAMLDHVINETEFLARVALIVEDFDYAVENGFAISKADFEQFLKDGDEEKAMANSLQILRTL